jgi:hypothetical protein
MGGLKNRAKIILLTCGIFTNFAPEKKAARISAAVILSRNHLKVPTDSHEKEIHCSRAAH